MEISEQVFQLCSYIEKDIEDEEEIDIKKTKKKENKKIKIIDNGII